MDPVVWQRAEIAPAIRAYLIRRRFLLTADLFCIGILYCFWMPLNIFLDR